MNPYKCQTDINKINGHIIKHENRCDNIMITSVKKENEKKKIYMHISILFFVFF